MNTTVHIILATAALLTGSLVHAADAPKAQSTPAPAAQTLSDPRPLTPEQRAMHHLSTPGVFSATRTSNLSSRSRRIIRSGRGLRSTGRACTT